MGRKSAIYLALALTLGAAGCSQQARTPQVNPVAACGSSAVLAQVKEALLPTTPSSDPAYLDKVQRAEVALSELRLAGFDANAGASSCTATAYLMARGIAGGDARVLQLAYTAGRGPDGQVYVSGLQAQGGGQLDQFAKLLNPKPAHVAAAVAPKPTPAPPPPALTPKSEPENTTGAAPSTLSDETQRLVDQAGDTRASGDVSSDNNVSSPQPNSLGER